MTKEEFEVEFEGIYNTIKSYTNDHYILGYINGLKSALINDDKSKICIIIPKLIDWYKNSMSSIQDSKFVYNKTQHIQTHKLLSDYYNSVVSQRV